MRSANADPFPGTLNLSSLDELPCNKTGEFMRASSGRNTLAFGQNRFADRQTLMPALGSAGACRDGPHGPPVTVANRHGPISLTYLCECDKPIGVRVETDPLGRFRPFSRRAAVGALGLPCDPSHLLRRRFESAA